KVAVSDVYRLYEINKVKITQALNKIGVIVKNARQAMQLGDIQKLGSLMLENHALLQELTVSSPELDALVDAAVRAGAYGAKLSGGGRGGNMTALVDENSKEAVENALYTAGAKRVFETVVEAS